MLLWNLDASEGLCNGSRSVVTELCSKIIKAKMFTGEFSGRDVHIPRITLDSSKSRLGCRMQRHQFPVRAAFAMNTQGTSKFLLVGIFLIVVFMHGMLYIAFSEQRQCGLKGSRKCTICKKRCVERCITKCFNREHGNRCRYGRFEFPWQFWRF